MKRSTAIFVTAMVVLAVTVATPGRAAAIGTPCLVPAPGPTNCAGTATFSSYYKSDAFRPFQAVAGNGQQSDILITFSSYVRNLRAWSNDPDYNGTAAWAYLLNVGWIELTSIDPDYQPGVFTVGGGGGISNGPFLGVLLETDPSDYANWRVEYQKEVNNSGPWCKIKTQTLNCQGVTASVSPFYQGSVFDPFQSVNNGSGAQVPIEVTFGVPLYKVSVYAVDPDYAGTRIDCYTASGVLIDWNDYTGDNRPGYTTVAYNSCEDFTRQSGITRIVLTPAANDYVVFQGITAWPLL